MSNKLNLKNGERVWICNLGNGEEYPGTVVGKSFEHIVDFYIIETDERPFGNLYNYDCVLLAESCLKRTDSTLR